jgi:hypothetical protein
MATFVADMNWLLWFEVTDAGGLHTLQTRQRLHPLSLWERARVRAALLSVLYFLIDSDASFACNIASDRF